MAVSTPADCTTAVVIIVDKTTAVRIRKDTTFCSRISFCANI